ncbi:MAG: pilus assembly protein FimV [Porticoccus sp.]|jgi:pilus assembly protein FimV
MKLLNAFVIAVCTVYTGGSFALNLGDAPESATLGDALELRIPIEADGLNADQIIVKIAPIDLHIKQKVDYSSIPSDIKLTVNTDDKGVFALITTQRPINQPYIEFIVKLQSSTGTLYKRYQVMLDP